MELMPFYTWACLLLSLIACKIVRCSANPTYYDVDSYDRYSSNDNDYALTYGQPLTRERLKTLNPGYYYVDDGYIAPVYGSSATGSRRQGSGDADAALPNNVRFTPLVRYKQTRTKRKKLFVPNFFG